jgi:hypothetical protein
MGGYPIATWVYCEKTLGQGDLVVPFGIGVSACGECYRARGYASYASDDGASKDHSLELNDGEGLFDSGSDDGLIDIDSPLSPAMRARSQSPVQSVSCEDFLASIGISSGNNSSDGYGGITSTGDVNGAVSGINGVVNNSSDSDSDSNDEGGQSTYNSGGITIGDSTSKPAEQITTEATDVGGGYNVRAVSGSDLSTLKVNTSNGAISGVVTSTPRDTQRYFEPVSVQPGAMPVYLGMQLGTQFNGIGGESTDGGGSSVAGTSTFGTAASTTTSTSSSMTTAVDTMTMSSAVAQRAHMHVQPSKFRKTMVSTISHGDSSGVGGSSSGVGGFNSGIGSRGVPVVGGVTAGRFIKKSVIGTDGLDRSWKACVSVPENGISFEEATSDSDDDAATGKASGLATDSGSDSTDDTLCDDLTKVMRSSASQFEGVATSMLAAKRKGIHISAYEQLVGTKRSSLSLAAVEGNFETRQSSTVELGPVKLTRDMYTHARPTHGMREIKLERDRFGQSKPKEYVASPVEDLGQPGVLDKLGCASPMLQRVTEDDIDKAVRTAMANLEEQYEDRCRAAVNYPNTPFNRDNGKRKLMSMKETGEVPREPAVLDVIVEALKILKVQKPVRGRYRARVSRSDSKDNNDRGSGKGKATRRNQFSNKTH